VQDTESHRRSHIRDPVAAGGGRGQNDCRRRILSQEKKTFMKGPEDVERCPPNGLEGVIHLQNANVEYPGAQNS